LKKAVWILLILVFLIGISGCGSKLDSNKFSPPEWIQGEWADAYKTNHYKFTDDNIILTTDIISMNFKELYKDVAVNETATGNLYEIKIGSGYDSEYKFAKTSDTTLNYWITSSGLTVGPVELIKQ